MPCTNQGPGLESTIEDRRFIRQSEGIACELLKVIKDNDIDIPYHIEGLREWEVWHKERDRRRGL